MKNKTVIMGHLCVLVFGISIMAMSCTQLVSPVPEPTLQYKNITALKNEAIERSPTWENPTSNTVYDYTITPGLPAGLTINTITGEISGTLSHTHIKTDYTVTARTTHNDVLKIYTATITIFIYVKPLNRGELDTAITAEIARQGNRANLSVIVTSEITNMSELFKYHTNFNGDIRSWDVSQVITMYAMFQGAAAFNQNISEWKTGAVQDMSYMFRGATAFNGNIGGWDVSKVTNMHRMFEGAEAFNQDISRWSVSKVTNMEYMFNEAKAFNQKLEIWDVAGTVPQTNMFNNTNLTSTPTWHILKVSFQYGEEQRNNGRYLLSIKNGEDISVAPTWTNNPSDAVYDYTITPNLPKGLTIDTKTGTISGTGKIPSGEVISETVHTITATNTVRSITSSVTIYIYP